MFQKRLKARSNYLQINIGFKKNQLKINVSWFFKLFKINSIFLVKTNQRYQYQCMNRKRKYQEQK